MTATACDRASVARAGATQDRTELVPGDVEAVRTHADHVDAERRRIKDAGEDFEAVSVQDALTSGLTSFAFLIDRSEQITRFTALVTVLETTHSALTTYAAALSTAQDEAQHAIRTWNEATRATQDAVTSYDAQVAAYNAVLCLPPPQNGVPRLTAGPPARSATRARPCASTPSRSSTTRGPPSTQPAPRRCRPWAHRRTPTEPAGRTPAAATPTGSAPRAT